MVKDKTCVVSKVTELVQSHVTTASLQSEISAELSYLLPFDESANFENLLLEIESKSEDLGISSFGTTATTLEEVFLKYVLRKIRFNETEVYLTYIYKVYIEF